MVYLVSFCAAGPARPTTYKGLTWSLWDRWTIEGDITTQELVSWFKARGLEAYSISAGPSILYNGIFPKHADRVNKKLRCARDSSRAVATWVSFYPLGIMASSPSTWTSSK